MSWPRLAVIESPTFAPALFERPWQVLTPIEPLLSGLGDRADEIAQPIVFVEAKRGLSMLDKDFGARIGSSVGRGRSVSKTRLTTQSHAQIPSYPGQQWAVIAPLCTFVSSPPEHARQERTS
jgi:hypothetical protein